MPLDGNRLRDLSVPHESLRRYLLTHGWQVHSALSAPEPVIASPMEAAFMRGRIPDRPSYEIFTLNEDGFGEVELIVPRGRFRADFERRLKDIFDTLADIEGREASAIVADVRTIGYDVIRSRIPDELVVEETIRLVSATSYLSGFKNLLASTATTEMAPDPYFLRVRKDGIDYAENCRFAHTFRGSFGFTIESPVEPNTKPDLDFGGKETDQRLPFSRRVVQRLTSGIRAIVASAETRDIAPLTAPGEITFSANMLEQFADIVQETSYGGLFSPEWTPPRDLRKPDEFMISVPHVEIARTAAKTLRARPIPQEASVFGHVIRLQNQADPTELFSETSDGEIIIKWESSDLGKVNVRVRLKPSDYQLALAAHGSGRRVRVSGTLQLEGRRWVLASPTGFSVAG